MHDIVQPGHYRPLSEKELLAGAPLLPNGCFIQDQGCVVVLAGSQKGQAMEGGAAC